MAVLIPVSGWLADRFHPIRVVIAGYAVNLLISLPASMVWLFWHPAPHRLLGVDRDQRRLTAPATALLGVYDPPLFMVTFPRSRYGQFCSANAMLRALAGIVGRRTGGVFFDFAGHVMTHQDVYRLMPVWQMVFTVPAFVCALLLYRSWKRYGGDADYVPPVPGEKRHVGHKDHVGSVAQNDQPVASSSGLPSSSSTRDLPSLPRCST